MRYWHLLLGTVFIYLAAHVKLGVPGPVASLGRWVLLAGAAAVSVWLLSFSRRAEPFPNRTGGIGAAVLVFCVLTLSTALAGFQVRLSVLKWILLSVQLFIFVYAANRLVPVRHWVWLVGGLFVLFAVPTMLTFMGAVTGYSPIVTFFGIYHQGRLAVLGNPNSVGMVALASGVTALWVQEAPFVRERWARRAVPLGVVVASALVVLWTASRSALGGLAVGGGIWAIATGKGARSIGLGALAVLALWVWSLDFSALDSLGMVVERLQGGRLLDTRESVWEASLRNWKEYPWFGHGYGVTEGGYDLEGLSGSVGSVRDGSGYFGVLESVGGMGLGGILVLYTAVARNVWHLWQLSVVHNGLRTQVEWLLGAMGGALFFGFSVNAIGEPWLVGPGSFPHLVFWCALGIHVAGTARVRTQMAEKSRHRSLVGSPAPSRVS
ncbi:O-antigen ligase family protein [Salinibacter ruber]|uniref:O-antigen ligase family protein n=1 Tax=Salinibacter ruber TaxID=146919 RepID=UPI00207415DD|nr:O-antigen ligase family protein [Salinibacter ruber]